MTLPWRWTSAALVLLAFMAGPVGAQDAASQLFDDGVLHEMRISLHADDWRRLQEAYQENTYYPADITWNGIRVRNVGIRSRGNASRSSQKPGLRVDIDRYISDQRFLGLKSFVLDNATQDASMLKEPLAMRMFAHMGLPAPREAYARLYVNERYQGLYLLVESIDKDFISRVYSAPGTEAGARERDGVLFEFQHTSQYYFTYPGPELEHYAAFFEPETHENDSPDTLYGPLRDMTRLINQASDSELVEVVSRYLDLSQWIRYVAVESFLAELDGMLGFAGMNNFYLYRFEGTTVSQVIPWDMDQSFLSATQSIWTRWDENVLMRRAMQLPQLRALYLDTLRQAAVFAATPAEDDPRAWLEREVDRMFEQIRDAAQADTTKPYSNDEFLAEVARLRQFARTRSAFVECEVANEASEREPQPCAVSAEPAATTRRR
jgi:hypothetical protein